MINKFEKFNSAEILCSLMKLTGATILPVCPTCMSFGTNPASTAALEAPTVKNDMFNYQSHANKPEKRVVSHYFVLMCTAQVFLLSVLSKVIWVQSHVHVYQG